MLHVYQEFNKCLINGIYRELFNLLLNSIFNQEYVIDDTPLHKTQ